MYLNTVINWMLHWGGPTVKIRSRSKL